MELKHKKRADRARGNISFNRTFMELKPHTVLNGAAFVEGFNRTFMELKPLSILETVTIVSRFNRTFMELKPTFVCK